MSTIGPLPPQPLRMPALPAAAPPPPPVPVEVAPADPRDIAWLPTIPLGVRAPKPDRLDELPTIPMEPRPAPAVLDEAKTIPMPRVLGELEVHQFSPSGAIALLEENRPQRAVAPHEERAARGAMLGGMLGGIAAAAAGLVGYIPAARREAAERIVTPRPEQLRQALSSPYAQVIHHTASHLASLPREQTRVAFELLESAMLDPKATVIEKRHLGGGINGSYLVTLSNGVRAVFKPYDGEDQEKLRDRLEKNRQGKREQAAYLVDKAMGHLGRVPPTVAREIEGAPGSLMLFVPDSKTAMDGKQARQVYNSADSCRRMAILDNVIGNLDRHEGNWMVSSDGKPIPIDHGLCFPHKNKSQGFINFDFDEPQELDPASRLDLKKLLSQRHKLSQELSPLLASAAIEATFERVERLLKDGKTSTWWQGQSS